MSALIEKQVNALAGEILDSAGFCEGDPSREAKVHKFAVELRRMMMRDGVVIPEIRERLRKADDEQRQEGAQFTLDELLEHHCRESLQYIAAGIQAHLDGGKR